MAHLQYMPGDPRLVDQLVYELKSKGIFDQFRKECIADVDTRPAYQNLRQRVENSVSTFLSRQCWKPDLNKNQLREKLRKHILDGNYLEQGVERIVDQVVNPKVASVFIPQVEDLVYNYLGITRKKAPTESADKPATDDLLPTDLEAVSPGSVKSDHDKDENMETEENTPKVEEEVKEELKGEVESKPEQMEENSIVDIAAEADMSIDKHDIPLPDEEIKLENIPAPADSPPKPEMDLDKIALPKEVPLKDIPLPEDDSKSFFKPINVQSEDSNSSSDSSLRRNMSPLTPIRNFNNENSCDAQQAFDNDSDGKNDEKKEPSSFRFAIESDAKENSEKTEKKEVEPELSYQFNQVNINAFNTPMYDDSSNSNNLRIDYESDTNSKVENKQDVENSEEIFKDGKKEKKSDDRKSSSKSSHRSRDSHRHSSSKDKRSDSKHSTSRDSSRHDKKSSSSSKDDKKSSKSRDRSKDRGDRKDSRDSSKHRSSSSSHKSSSHRDSKSHKSSSSNHRYSSKSSDAKKSSSSSSREKEKSSESKDKKDSSSRDKDKKDSKSSSHRSDKDRKSSSSSKKSDEKDKKKDKKDTDDHYSSSGRGNNTRRSTDRDSNDGSSSSKGSQNQNGSKTSDGKKESKSSSSKSDNTSPSGDSTSPSDKDNLPDNSKLSQFKPVRVENLETPIINQPRPPFVPDVTLKKPKFAANFEEAKKMMKMRKFLDDEQKRMNQEAALLLEFQANVRPSLSQVYSSIPGPELEFVCGSNTLVANTCDISNAEKENVNFAVPHAVIDRNTKPEAKRNKCETENLLEGKHYVKFEESIEEIQKNIKETESTEKSEAHKDGKNEVSYDENKPFSLLVEEISEYGKASESKNKEKADLQNENEMQVEVIETKNDIEIQIEDQNEIQDIKNQRDDNQVNIITENQIVDEPEDSTIGDVDQEIIPKEVDERKNHEITIDQEKATDYDIFKRHEVKESENNKINIETQIEKVKIVSEDVEIIQEKGKKELKYFTEKEISSAETERNEFDKFLMTYSEQVTSKLYLINCDSYEENIVKEIARDFGDFEVINYYKNGHLKLPNSSKNIVKDIPLSEEVVLPIEASDYDEKSSLFSPVKSDCSFELSSDYDAKLNEIVNKKSRKEVLEIILGGVIDADGTNTDVESEITEYNIKRKMEDESLVNNNRSVLTPTKIRKLSDSDQISSTTEDKEEVSNNNKIPNTTRSKYLGKAKRVGLPRPKRCNLVNSPSSDKSVENYVQNTQTDSPQPPNGKIKTTPRTKVQRYDTSDLYKPKLHYLSRRNNVS